MLRGKWLYKSVFGSEEDAVVAEQKMGVILANNLMDDIDIVEDPSMQNLINEIGMNLCKQLKNQRREFRFYILRSKDINAFALPGGYIFITLGLLNRIKNYQDEIAFVLSHEIMHVILGHPMSRIFAEYSTQLISSVLMRVKKISAIANQLITKYIRSNYSQENELEADAYGISLMQAVGYDSLQAKNLLGRLNSDSSDNPKILNYFQSHPPINERIKQINSILQ